MEMIARDLERIGASTVDGLVMQDFLKQEGASLQDLKEFLKHWHSEMGQDEVYGFRKTTQTRWHIDPSMRTARRLVRAAFKIPYGGNPILKELERNFPEAAPEFLDCSATRAVMKVLMRLMKLRIAGQGPCPQTAGNLGYMCGMHQFRIVLEPGDDDAEGPAGTTKKSPTPEGVHQEGAQMVLIMYVNSRNMAPRSGESRVYSLEQDSGVLDPAKSREARSRTRLFERNLVTPFEAVVVDDQRVKHDNRPIEVEDGAQAAFRDELVVWVREFHEADREAPP
jgi:hypothetical protein